MVWLFFLLAIIVAITAIKWFWGDGLFNYWFWWAVIMLVLLLLVGWDLIMEVWLNELGG